MWKVDSLRLLNHIPHRLFDNTLAKTSDERFPSRDRLLHLWKRERGFVAGLVIPHLSNPDRVLIRRILGNNVTQTAGDADYPLEEPKE